MAKYAVGYLIAFLFLAVILTGFIGFGGRVTVIDRPGVVVPGLPEPGIPALPPLPEPER